MPGGDRTGPLGEGPMTGRQLGYGAGFNNPGYLQRFGFGRGGGRGFGLGFGLRNRDLKKDIQFNTSGSELNQIKEEVNLLKNSLDSLIERLSKVKVEENKK